ncbi:unnamed protein product [Adineta steineri]|uniref:Insulin-like domain-containing protein n=1 Tax=Adineta steineri TaxID=433720 RepID=A0A815LTN0_9BILA|nr:unnamed protein product [Adineta steineri]CAF1407491.1 unnamed protein product [Adineta steineri]
MCVKTILFILFVLLIRNTWSKENSPSSDEPCTMSHNGTLLHEGDIIGIKGKLYKFEDCGLHRAYHVCGTQIMSIISIVCQALYKEKPSLPGIRYSRFVRQKLLTEACCHDVCTVSEMTRYCP